MTRARIAALVEPGLATTADGRPAASDVAIDTPGDPVAAGDVVTITVRYTLPPADPVSHVLRILVQSRTARIISWSWGPGGLTLRYEGALGQSWTPAGFKGEIE